MLIGKGHLYRCLSLASFFLSKKWIPIFLIKSDDESVKIIKKNDFLVEIIDLNASFESEIDFTLKIIKKYNSKCIFFDLTNAHTLSNLDFFSEYIMTIHRKISNVIMIDGIGNDSICEKILLPIKVLIVPYFNVKTQNYFIPKKCVFLKGVKYFIFRKEFIAQKKKIQIFEKKRKRILISLGGSNTTNLLLKIINALKFLKKYDFETRIIIGFENEKLKKRIGDLLEQFVIPFKILFYSSNMAKEISLCDILVANSGLTKYEAALLGIPTIVISTVLNHDSIMRKFAKKKTCDYLGYEKMVTERKVSNAIKKKFLSCKERMKFSYNCQKHFSSNGLEKIYYNVEKKLYEEN